MTHKKRVSTKSKEERSFRIMADACCGGSGTCVMKGGDTE